VSGAPVRILRAAGRELELGGRPWVMGILNTSPDSFSDPGAREAVDAQLRRARRLVEEGADVIDVGGESGRTDRPAISPEQEIARVVPLVERLAAAGLGASISVDTYKPAVAEAAVAAGAAIVNDVSGLRDPELADVCAQTGAGLVLTHTVAAPKHKVLDHAYADVVAEIRAFLDERMRLASSRGVAFEQLVLDPGPDLGKTPAQTVAALRGLPALHELGRPLLLAVSRKDFIGALTGTPPRARLAGTLAAVGFAADAGAHLLRVHDVREVVEFLAVRTALGGDRWAEP
jgi:dihydropteroate synthase